MLTRALPHLQLYAHDDHSADQGSPNIRSLTVFVSPSHSLALSFLASNQRHYRPAPPPKTSPANQAFTTAKQRRSFRKPMHGI